MLYFCILSFDIISDTIYLFLQNWNHSGTFRLGTVLSPPYFGTNKFCLCFPIPYLVGAQEYKKQERQELREKKNKNKNPEFV